MTKPQNGPRDLSRSASTYGDLSPEHAPPPRGMPRNLSNQLLVVSAMKGSSPP